MSNKHKQRTYARNRAVSRKGKEIVSDTDASFFMKLVLFALLGMVWLRLSTPLELPGMSFSALPVGFVAAAIAVPYVEKFHFNRKIWYAVLLMTAFVSFTQPVGLVL